jgi:predicted alpha/beta-hydrolase family hydrolase
MPAAVNECAAIDKDGVRGFLHAAQGTRTAGLVLTHGAGGNCNAPLLVALASAFSMAGVSVLRCDLPLRQKRHPQPPSPATGDRSHAGLRAAVELLRQLQPGAVYLGGQSYGGRQASMLAAEQPGLTERLLLLSYPLHPPGKPGQLRTAHFPNLRTPAVFVQGTVDPFGSIAELQSSLTLIPAPTKLLPIERAGHDLKRGAIDLNPIVAAVMD